MIKKTILFSLLIFLLHSCGTRIKPIDNAMINLQVDAFKSELEKDNRIVLDVRTPRETALGKIENAIEIDIRAKGFEEKIKSLDKTKTYLVYCKSGVRSVKACKILEKNGFKNIYNLLGGYKAWEASQLNP